MQSGRSIPMEIDEKVKMFQDLVSSGERDSQKLCAALGVNAKELNSIRLKYAWSLVPALTPSRPAKPDAQISGNGRLVVSKEVMEKFAQDSGVALSGAVMQVISTPASKMLLIQFS